MGKSAKVAPHKPAFESAPAMFLRAWSSGVDVTAVRHIELDLLSREKAERAKADAPKPAKLRPKPVTTADRTVPLLEAIDLLPQEDRAARHRARTKIRKQALVCVEGASMGSPETTHYVSPARPLEPICGAPGRFARGDYRTQAVCGACHAEASRLCAEVVR